jgi:DNA-binding NarL/FixJ family response regulator
MSDRGDMRPDVVPAESPDARPAARAPLRILIAEDHTILSEGLRALLSREPGIEVVGIAENGQEAVAAAAALLPDLVLMDLSMPEMDGLSAIREIRQRQINTKLLVLTAHKTEEHVRAALQAGANGFALKDVSHTELFMAIRSIARGKSYLSPEVSGCIVSGYLESGMRPGPCGLSDSLTQREVEVLRCVAEGRRNREIAQDLAISIKTVEKHRASVMHKLHMENAAELTAYAHANGLLPRSD